MNDALDLIWRRAELRNPILSAVEISLWPRDQRDSIINLGLIRRISDAQALTCEDCGTPHSVEILRNPGKSQHPYYFCPEIGRVAVSAEELRRWEVDFDQLAVLLRRSVGLTDRLLSLIPARIWLLGRKRTEHGYWELFLLRGLCWSDGLEILTRCSRLRQSPTGVITVPYRFPSIEAATVPWPVRTLSEVTHIEGSNLVADLEALSIAGGALALSKIQLGQKVRATRASRSVGSQEAVAAVIRFLEATGLSETTFANQFKTTDRTIRNFLKTGRMRRSNFEDMAAFIGISVDGLLCGELPASVARIVRS